MWLNILGHLLHSFDFLCLNKALENEIIAHEPLIDAVVSMSHHMVAKKHPATKNIEARLDDLLVRLKELKDLSGDRKLKLLDAVESQTVTWFSFYSPTSVTNFMIKYVGHG